MERLSLLKSNEQVLEKRVFPRFPFSYLTFKTMDSDDNKVFAVRDISFTGMQIFLKDGGHTYRVNDKIKGNLHWKKASADIEGEVVWVNGSSVGITFKNNAKSQSTLREFLCIDNIMASMRPLHKEGLDLDLPANLACWLQADGPIEVFVWRHNDGEVSGFHLIMMDCFVEYVDGKGLKSGKILKSRELDSPLNAEEEFDFLLDETLDQEKLNFAKSIVDHLGQEHCPEEIQQFLSRKLGL